MKPKTLAAAADMLYTIRTKRLLLQKEVEAYQKQETELRERLIAELPKGDATGVQGKLCRVSVITKARPNVENWDKFYAYVKKTGNFDLMQRRLSDAAVKERWENNKEIPGVGRFNIVDLSVNKV